jgi:hypothetical protein
MRITHMLEKTYRDTITKRGHLRPWQIWNIYIFIMNMMGIILIDKIFDV